MDLYFGGEDDSLFLIEGLLIVDVLKEMSFEDVFSGGALFSFDVDFPESFALILKVLKM